MEEKLYFTLLKILLILVLATSLVVMLLAVLKWLINRSKYKQCMAYREMYRRYLRGEEPESQLQQIKHQVLQLFKGAGVQDVHVSTLAPNRALTAARSRNIPYVPGPLSAFELFPTNRADLASLLTGKFDEALGAYQARMEDALNPLYWVERIAYLPRYTAMYLGVSPDNILTKLLSIAYGLFWLVITLLSAVISSDLLLEWLLETLGIDFFNS